jgi:branched-chain amino acid transport system ATP-binding protein
MTEPLLEVEGIRKEFGGLVAVDDVDLTIEPNQVYGLIGPNGAGKSTLFNMIAGLLKPTAGTVRFHGEDITGLEQYKISQRGIARTFQTPRPFESQTVRENVVFGLRYGGGKTDESIADEWLEFVDLGDKTTMHAGDLTMTEQKRLDLARALATDPDLLLLDEIMAGLNPSEVDAFVDLIAEIAEERTVFVIEHIMKAIMNVSKRIFVLENGQKIAEGTPDEIASNDQVITAYLGEEFVQNA